VQNDVWNESAHGGNTLLTLVKLADNADDESREAWPSVALLTEKTRASRRTVQRALRELQAGGVTMTPGTQREPSEEPKALPAASAREPELEDVSVPSELGAAFAEVTAI